MGAEAVLILPTKLDGKQSPPGSSDYGSITCECRPAGAVMLGLTETINVPKQGASIDKPEVSGFRFPIRDQAIKTKTNIVRVLRHYSASRNKYKIL